MPKFPVALDPFAQKVRDQRWRVSPWRLRAERLVIPHVRKQHPRRTGRILSYHSTGTPAWGVNDVSPDGFLQQMNWAKSADYRFVDVSAVVEGTAGPRDLAITFDDGLRSILAVTPFLQDERIPYTVFVVSTWPGSDSETFLSWPEIEVLVAAGASIGSHSVTHPNFRELEEAARVFELTESRRIIGEHLGRAPDLFAIPFGRARDWSPESTRLANKVGYTAVFGQAEQRTPRGTIGRSFISKFDGLAQFRAVLEGRFDDWEEWF